MKFHANLLLKSKSLLFKKSVFFLLKLAVYKVKVKFRFSRWRMEIESGGTRALGLPSLAWADELSQTRDRLASCGFPDRQSRPSSATGAGGFEVLIANCKLQISLKGLTISTFNYFPFVSTSGNTLLYFFGNKMISCSIHVLSICLFFREYTFQFCLEAR